VNWSRRTASALEAVQHGKLIPAGEGNKLYVDRFQKRSERQVLLDRVTLNIRRERAEKSKNLNLYVKNLDDDVTKEKLIAMFSEFGIISSAVVMLDNQGISRGFGFVCFEKDIDAEKALTEIRTKYVGKKPLFVARAQRKEERRIQLENEFQTSMVQRMQYSQLFYPPAVMSQPGMYYAHQMMRPRMPMTMRGGYQSGVMYNPQNKRGGGRPGYYPQSRGGSISQNRPNQRGGRIPQTRGNHQPPVTPAPIVSSNQGKDLASILAAESSLERQKNILGERLFPLIHKDHPQLAGKITGMLLEMDVSEILNLLDSPSDRQSKINEALEVLNSSK